MKSLFLRLLSPAKLRRIDIILTLLPALLWIAAVSARPYVIRPRCSQNPAQCSPTSLYSVDRLAVGYASVAADESSFVTQDLSGILAFALPTLFNLSQIPLLGVTPALALAHTATDLVLILQSVFWNGSINEIARLISQRPRPFVYADPTQQANLENYTSFYSGHTSFSAAANTACFLVLLARGLPLGLLIFMGAAGEALIFFTGLFRVLAGRHFVTDVLAGALAGTLIAIGIALLHRPRGEP